MTFTWGLLLLLCAYGGTAQLQVVSTENSQVLDASSVVVGTASDLALQVRCESSSDSTTTTWMRDDAAVSQGLSAFGVSQENGVLRVYPVSQLSLGVNTFTCTSGVETLTVQFDRRPNLFFTSTVPEQAPAADDVTTLCPVPDIPAAMVTAVNGTGFSYCQVSTARGSFRSRSIITEEGPSPPTSARILGLLSTSESVFSFGGIITAVCRGVGDVAVLLQNATIVTSVPNFFSGEFPANDINSGFYQCGTTSNGLDTENLFVSVNTSSYALVAFVRNIAVTPPTQTITQAVDIGCIVEGNPLPRISWSVNGNFNVNSTQSVTDFMEMASSTLTVSVSDLNLGMNSVTCTAAVDAVSPILMESSRASVILQAAPVITTPPMSITVTAPEDAVFTCTARGFPLPTISWRRVSDNTILTDGENIMISGSGSEFSTTSTLTFSPTDPSLSGDYECVANNTVGMNSESAPLTVNAVPVITTHPMNVSVVAPDSATLSCSAEGSPAPTIEWRRLGDDGSETAVMEGVNIMTTGSTAGLTVTSNLTFSPTDLTHNGVYDCLATNEVGSANASALLTVNAVPVITTPPTNITVTAPEDAVFTCTARGFPLPTISWRRVSDDTILMDGENIMISGSSSEFSTTSTLTFSPTDPSLSGDYECVASNSVDMRAESATLTVNAVPVITTPPMDVTVTAPEDAVFTCTARGFPLPTISWRRVSDDTILMDGGNIMISGSSSEFSTTSTLTFSPTDPSLSGDYECVANNTVGMNAESATLTVNAVPVITTPPMNVSVVAPDSATLSCSAEGSPAPTIEWRRLGDNGSETAVMEGVNIMTTVSTAGLTVTSNLTFSPTDLTHNGVYLCLATNIVGSANASALLTVNAAPVFLVDPTEEIIAVDGDTITLSCSVQGNPLPVISWMVNTSNGTVSPVDSNFTVTLTNMTDVFTQSSTVSFEAEVTEQLRGNGTMLYCVAGNNVTGGVESNRTLLTIAGPPLRPAVNISESSRSALISWSEPFSLIPITNYTITISETISGEPIITMENIPGNSSYFNATSLRPFVNHTLTILAVNRAGASQETTETFVTLQDVPAGFPMTVQSRSQQLREITVSWSPLLSNETNGIITGYSVRYRISGGASQFMNVPGEKNLSTILSVNAGDTYLLSVAGVTAIGVGPYSEPEISQLTVEVPPTFPADPLPAIGSPTPTTITITLPSIPGPQGSFSHYWVVVMRLGSGDFNQTQDPSTLFPDNSTFTNYSSSVPADTPYVAAEINSANYQSSMTFVLGDEEGTMSVNDFPDLYRNGPLQQGSTYTAFVWAFSVPVPDGMRAKRQSGDERQYVIFSSSPFLSPVGTAVPAALADGAIAGIVIAIVLLLIVIVGIIIVCVMLYERYKVTKQYGLPQPPSRKGSMRIRDQREIIPSVTTLRNLKAEAELQRLNLSHEDSRNPVLVEDFPTYVKSMHANTDHLFSEEYEILSIKSPSLPHVQCSMPYNVAKNRYANINCFDDTRVKLDPIPSIDGSDYINANYLDGYLEKRGFIATQGPLAQTTPDFWRMVWEKNSCCIIMLTNVVEKNRAKCHQYWPEVGSLNMGDISVTLIEIQQLAYYTVRTFRMSRGNDRREVKQFHYTGWPDFGVPDYPHPVIAFIKRINNFKRTTPGPYVIHCSAGVGRTGTMMTVQAMMQMMEEEGKLDIFNFVLGLRHQRNYMVQTERQYIFIHDCIMEILKMGETSIPIQTLRRRHKELLAHDPQMDTSKMEAEYARLNELQIVEESQFEPARLPVNKPKNRFQEILPYDRYRVRLLLHPGVVGSDFINASYIDGYQHRHQYIVTQGPMKHTVMDFWRMIWEHRVSCILMLCPLEEKGKEQSVRYWPTEKINQQGDMFIELTQQTDYGSYSMREFSVTNTKINESRVIKHYQYSDWLEDTMPTNAATVIDLIGVLQKTQHMLGGGPIVVHDSSGVGRSATFCILGSILEQLKVEGTVDLFSFIHSLRHQQPGLVNSFELYKFCYQAVIEFLDSFDHYANFD